MRELEINPADYDYMDDMALEGWMWEFIRRNEGYQRIYSECELIGAHYKRIMRKYNELKQRYSIRPILQSEHEEIESEYFLVIDIIGFYRVCIAKPETKYNQFIDHKPIIDGATPVISYQIGPDELEGNGYLSRDRCERLINEVLPPVELTETIFLGIAKTAKRSHILRELGRILARTQSPQRQVRRREDKWKYYLITYDLKQKGYNYSQIADILYKAYPSEILLFAEEKNIEYYHKAALALINEGYKKYLTL